MRFARLPELWRAARAKEEGAQAWQQGRWPEDATGEARMGGKWTSRVPRSERQVRFRSAELSLADPMRAPPGVVSGEVQDWTKPTLNSLALSRNAGIPGRHTYYAARNNGSTLPLAGSTHFLSTGFCVTPRAGSARIPAMLRCGRGEWPTETRGSRRVGSDRAHETRSNMHGQMARCSCAQPGRPNRARRDRGLNVEITRRKLRPAQRRGGSVGRIWFSASY